MRKILTVLFIIIFASGVFAAAQKDKKVRRVDNMLAVFDLEVKGKIDKDISLPLSESIRLEIHKSGKYELVDRGNMDKIFSEQKFQLSGCVSGQCVVEAGQLLGVGKIIAGSVSKLGSTFYLSLSLINAETGKIEAASEDECKCEVDDLIKSSKRLIKRLLGDEPFDYEQKPVTVKEIPQSEKPKSKSSSLDKGLVAYYPFNGNANDESGNGNNGTIQNARLTSDRFGNTTSAIYLSGVNDYIALPGDIMNGEREGTLSVWIKLDAGNTDSAIFSKGTTFDVWVKRGNILTVS